MRSATHPTSVCPCLRDEMRGGYPSMARLSGDGQDEDRRRALAVDLRRISGGLVVRVLLAGDSAAPGFVDANGADSTWTTSRSPLPTKALDGRWVCRRGYERTKATTAGLRGPAAVARRSTTRRRWRPGGEPVFSHRDARNLLRLRRVAARISDVHAVRPGAVLRTGGVISGRWSAGPRRLVAAALRAAWRAPVRPHDRPPGWGWAATNPLPPESSPPFGGFADGVRSRTAGSRLPRTARESGFETKPALMDLFGRLFD